MNPNQQQILTNTYIPKNQRKKEYESYGHDLMTYINELKYKRFVENMDSYFSQARYINFDIINHECQSDPLQNLRQYYETI